MEKAIEVLRQQLLDISKRNRLTNTPVGKRRVKQLEIEDERSDEIFRILYLGRKKMTFEAYRGALAEDADEGSGQGLFVPAYNEAASDLAAHHVDRKLQTRLTAEGLQKRLLTLYRDAQGIEEEQGVSVLFLALGFLRWYESESSDVERFAPLVLLPVDLERDSARGRFRLTCRDQDLEPNLSLAAMLANDFELKLPEFPEGEDWLPSDYFELTRRAVSSQPRWQVQANTIVLGFYSFAKFLMWRDLAPENEWGAEGGLVDNSLVEGLLLGGFESEGSLAPPEENLDQRFPDPRELGHILDADASQTQVIAAVREGRNLVVQGPPGTGKSQTIANIIGVAVKDGKRVLFVAEKRAALDVVHARLERCDLGPLCLELHSHKAVRRHVYDDLKRTLELGPPLAVDEGHYGRVRAVRDELNRLSTLLHAVDDVSGQTPYRVIGRLSMLDESGFVRPDFRVDNADRWSRDEFRRRVAAVEALAALTAEQGREREHLWRGANRRLTQFDRRALAETVGEAMGRLRAARQSLARAAHAIGLSDAGSLGAVEPAAKRLEAFEAAPDLVLHLLQQDAVLERSGSLLELCEETARLQALRKELLSDLVESALQVEWAETRLAVAAHGKSLFRWLNGDYKRAVSRLRGVQRAALPKTLDERLALLDRLLEYRKRKNRVERNRQLGSEVLGDDWRDEDTDVTRVLPAIRWIVSQEQAPGSAAAVRKWFEEVPPGLDCAEVARSIRADYDAWKRAWKSVVVSTDLDLVTAFGAERVETVDSELLEVRLEAWLAGMDSYDGWHRLATAGRQTSELGLDELRERLADGRLGPDEARGVFEFAHAEAVWERLRGDTPELGLLDGAERAANVESFKRLDQQLQGLASQEAALKHFEALPVGSAGQVGIVRGECNKKRRHMPLRKLLDKAGEAVATIKPVFLMSPLSVAQFLRPGGLTFDLLLIDEASQVRPADAMGAILRSRRVVVVGDQKQLPPTSFFDRQVGGEDEVDYEDIADLQAAQVGDMESILSLCDSRAMAGLMLRWHYRSMHPSLIDVSNHEFYGDGLVCPPSPEPPRQNFGLSFVHVDGEYGRGRKRDNPKEADAVAREVLRHAREEPERTLGVVALSVAQRDTIRDRVEYMRTQHPELDAFCREAGEEPFFVKNLENVQGDERDVIFISIGYGRDASGYMAQSFGPVSASGGERRLNVLFTRARQTCRVFSSIRHGDIRLDATRHEGPRVLKRFLKYAETGELDVPLISDREMDSPFEEAVAQALQEHGYAVAAQVGSAGFRIDLAVRDPDDEGRFLLAVECDGARYHSSRWARERDRLRQAVLEDKGWTFHRIWSTDWFYNRGVELRKLLDAVEKARSSRGAQSLETGRGAAPAPGPRVEREPRSVEPELPRVVYREASHRIAEAQAIELHEAPLATLAEHVVRIVEVEAPVHVEEVARRMSRLWGYRRAGRRIQDSVVNAAAAAVRSGRLQYCGSAASRFLEMTGSGPPTVRDRSAVGSPTLRKVEMISPGEIRTAILEAVERNVGITVAECSIEVARALGFKSTSADMRGCVERNAKQLVADGRLLLLDGQLRLP
jgi:very-short-patch-repair endonuclease